MDSRFAVSKVMLHLSKPIASTSAITSVTANSATGGGEVSSDGGAET